jgi:deoxyribonuclease-4
MTTKTLVPNILNTLNKTKLCKLLPKNMTMPELDTSRYPNAIISIFSKENCYSQLGIIVELLLRYSPNEIDMNLLCQLIKKCDTSITEDSLIKVRKSKTTQPFLNRIISTRTKMDTFKIGEFRYDESVEFGNIEGHPDARTNTQIFEIQLVKQLKKKWKDFLYQVFAYGALCPEITDVYLVLPLQDFVWHFNISNWNKRECYRDFLNTVNKEENKEENLELNLRADVIRINYHIGFHVSKDKSLVKSVLNLLPYGIRPFQIFLGGPQTSLLNIQDDELGKTAQLIDEHKIQLYVHSQYIINLCAEPEAQDNYHTKLLIKNLNYSKIIGCKGVVVHVGKSTNKPLKLALENMRTNLLIAIENATPECPILLETPAGQGTETLTEYEDFVEFVKSFEDQRLRICIDTCHVFACGSQPLEYIKKVSESDIDLLKLIHYNDSKTPCGSCVDRHAYMGTGHIGLDKMEEIAEYCHSNNLPMVIE